MLILATACSFSVFGQIPNVDSIQKTILESVRRKLDERGASASFFDTSKMFSGKFPINFKQLFKEVNRGLAMAKSSGDIDKLSGGYYNLSALDSMSGNYKGAYEHYKLYALYRDSLQKKEAEKNALQVKMQYEFDKKQAIAKAEQEKKDAEARRIKNLQYFTIAGLAVLFLVILVIALIQWRNNLQKKKANALLQLQKEKVESTLSELKSTQAQLIQSEKMASLGELTAGIAHEIQNPLNFVNNFSEVNSELIGEMKKEIEKGNFEGAKLIAKDIESNQNKINQHGRRADGIVKGMLQHSRTSGGQKEWTDINGLCDEYLRLAYHGFRAKDKSFKAKFETDFDASIGKINVVPQEISRVILNLVNNAFYAVSEKAASFKLQAASVPAEQPPYEPLVVVQTKRLNEKIEIRVSDNGNGVPKSIIDKIFQPFFTTKPTGQGTGLGLSLSYDIVKAHGGELKVETKEGEGSEFLVLLPNS